MAQFYLVGSQRDLLEGGAVLRKWGRVGRAAGCVLMRSAISSRQKRQPRRGRSASGDEDANDEEAAAEQGEAEDSNHSPH